CGLEDLLGVLDRQFLDLDAAFGTAHQDRQADRPIQDNAQVDLARQLALGLDDQNAGNTLSLRVLLGGQGILKHYLGDLVAFLARAAELDTPEAVLFVPRRVTAPLELALTA